MIILERFKIIRYEPKLNLTQLFSKYILYFVNSLAQIVR